MRKSLSRKISVFLSLESDILKTYYNVQDPAPLYRRELSQTFEKYILSAVRNAKRNSSICYKVSYRNEPEKQFAEPLLYAIRRHFSAEKELMMTAFENFKRKTYILLFVSLTVVMICHILLPFLLKDEESSLHTGLKNSLDVFSWVILWKPIDRLVFYWTPYLKDISILEKLEKAEVVISSTEEDPD